jgi:hypothetical protein
MQPHNVALRHPFTKPNSVPAKRTHHPRVPPIPSRWRPGSSLPTGTVISACLGSSKPHHEDAVRRYPSWPVRHFKHNWSPARSAESHSPPVRISAVRVPSRVTSPSQLVLRPRRGYPDDWHPGTLSVMLRALPRPLTLIRVGTRPPAPQWRGVAFKHVTPTFKPVSHSRASATVVRPCQFSFNSSWRYTEPLGTASASLPVIFILVSPLTRQHRPPGRRW